MPSKQQPTGYRLPPEMKARIAQVAKDEKVTAHAAGLLLLTEALAVRGLASAGVHIAGPIARVTRTAAAKAAAAQNAASAKTVLAQAEARAAHLATPKPKRKRSSWDLSKVQVGPTHLAPGALLKGKK